VYFLGRFWGVVVIRDKKVCQCLCAFLCISRTPFIFVIKTIVTFKSLAKGEYVFSVDEETSRTAG
jgi:hypothetical protein